MDHEGYKIWRFTGVGTKPTLVEEITEAVESKTLLAFSSSMCNPCKQQHVILDKLEKEYKDIAFESIVCDDDMDRCIDMDVSSVPTLNRS